MIKNYSLQFPYISYFIMKYELYIENHKYKVGIKDYIFWELELFKLVGYDLEFKDLVDKYVIGNQSQYISKSITEKNIS